GSPVRLTRTGVRQGSTILRQQPSQIGPHTRRGPPPTFGPDVRHRATLTRTYGHRATLTRTYGHSATLTRSAAPQTTTGAWGRTPPHPLGCGTDRLSARPPRRGRPGWSLRPCARRGP